MKRFQAQFRTVIFSTLITSTFVFNAYAVMSVVLAADLNEAINASKDVLNTIKTQNYESCLSSAKAAKQHYKILVGDFSDTPVREDFMGKHLDKTMQRFKKAKNICNPENQASEIQAMEETIGYLEKYQSQVKQRR